MLLLLLVVVVVSELSILVLSVAVVESVCDVVVVGV